MKCYSKIKFKAIKKNVYSETCIGIINFRLTKVRKKIFQINKGDLVYCDNCKKTVFLILNNIKLIFKKILTVYYLKNI